MLISNTFGTPAWLRSAARTEFYIKTGLVLFGARNLAGQHLEVQRIRYCHLVACRADRHCHDVAIRHAVAKDAEQTTCHGSGRGDFRVRRFSGHRNRGGV